MSKLQELSSTIAACVLALGASTTTFAHHVGPGTTGGVDVKAVHDNDNIFDGTTPTPSFDAFNDGQNETSVAISPINPQIIAIGANDHRMAGWSYLFWVGLYVSSDEGSNWFNTMPPGFYTDTSPEGTASPLMTIPYAYAADPVIRFDKDGNLYFVGVAYQPGGAPASTPTPDSAIFISKYNYTPGTTGGVSTVNGAGNPPNFTYAFTTIVERGSVSVGPAAIGYQGHGKFEDKPWFEIDRNGSSPCLGHIYVAQASQMLQDGNRLLVFSRSVDGGASFSQPKPLAVSGQDGSIVAAGAVVAVDQAGTIYVAYRTSALVAADPSPSIRIVTSQDCGLTFSKPVTAANLVPVRIDSPIRMNQFAAIAVDDLVPGIVYLTYRSGSGNPLTSNIFVVRSTDGGATWGAPTKVNDDSTSKGKFFPSIAVSQGAVHVAWYDLRNSPSTGNVANVYYASSNTSGVTYPQFSHNVAVTDVGFDPDCNVLGPTGAFLGDYMQLDARFDGYKHIVHISWADNRDVNPCLHLGSPFPWSDLYSGVLNTNVYTDRLVVDP